MTIDIHELLEKNPITRNMVRPKFGYKYLGAYNPLENQLLYDKKTGDIYTYYDKPNVLDKIASRHDICYSVRKNKNDCDRIMVDEINNIPYKDRPWGTYAIKQIINTKQKLGLGVENHNKILFEELHKSKRKNYPRRTIIVNHIDEIFAVDLVEMQKLTNKLSEKINNSNGELLNIYNIDGKSALDFVKNVYKKHKNALLYKPRNGNIKEVSLESIMNSIKNNKEIGKSDREHIYNIYRTNNDLKDITIDYIEYKIAMDDIEKFRNVDIKKDIKSKSKALPTTSKKSLIPRLKDNLSKIVVQNILEQGYNKIKIDLLKKKILKVRYISNNRKIHNDLLKGDYQISDNMKNAILKIKNINKLSKNEYDVYNALQKYKNNDKLQLLISSYLAGNKSKDLYNKINELLYNNYRNNKISKKEYQNIINKL